jgi:MerR family transcriptional regulator, thiopeptide resistance regulator
MKESIAQSKARVRNWTKRDWAKAGDEFKAICQDLVEAMRQGASPESPAVQQIIRRHFQWLTQFWTPTRESYAGHGQFVADSELRQAYEAHDPRLPELAAAAMKVFAERELR